MRWIAVLVGLAACGQPLPKQTEFPTLAMPEGATPHGLGMRSAVESSGPGPTITYNTRIADLRTMLSRAGMGLRVAGLDDAYASSGCSDFTNQRVFGRCIRCELVGEDSGVDGVVLEAATRAFSVYPSAALEATKIDHLALCTDIVYSENGEIQHPAGTVDVHGHGMLVSLGSFIGRTYDADGDRTVDDIIHHELFHLLEHEHMSELMIKSDPEWLGLDPEFIYGEAQTPIGSWRRRGFVNPYAMTNSVEDKASVYQYLMVHSAELCEIARDDEILRAKTRIVWRRVARALGGDAFMRAAAPCVDWI